MDLEILKIASDTNYNKYLKNHTHYSKSKNSICGDEIQIGVIIEKDKITDFGYQTKSCIYCQASASLLSKISINQQKKFLESLCNNAVSFFEVSSEEKKLNKLISFNKLLTPKNLSRKECILLPFKALKKIVSLK